MTTRGKNTVDNTLQTYQGGKWASLDAYKLYTAGPVGSVFVDVDNHYTVTIGAAAAANTAGGNLSFSSGLGDGTGNGGSISFFARAGGSTSGDSGSIGLTTATVSSGSGDSGRIDNITGDSVNGSSGGYFVTVGNSVQDSGDMQFTVGSSSAGSSGDMRFVISQSELDTGLMQFEIEDSISGEHGYFQFTTSGSLQLALPVVQTPPGASTDLLIKTGDKNGQAGDSGSLSFETGTPTSASASSGGFSFTAANSGGTGNGGGYSVQCGHGNSGNGGGIDMRAGSGSVGGSVFISSAPGGTTGTLTLAAGYSPAIVFDFSSANSWGTAATGDVLTKNASGVVEWTTPSSGESTYVEATISSNTTLTDPGTNHAVQPVDSSGGAVTITLPASPTTNAKFTVKALAGTSGANSITIAGNGNTIDGSATADILTAHGSKTLIYSGSEWLVY